ncbi:MAG: hypothetical protein GY898_24670 [Proteobacteria bacterium]|nr:hypothetical protein [Pseudomonadota bacterium]
MSHARAGWAVLATLLAASPAAATQAELFGPSIKSASMGGASGALEDGAHPLTTNSAGLGLLRHDAFHLQYLGGHVFLSEVDGVVRRDGSDEVMPKVTVQPHVFAIGFAKMLGPWVTAAAHVQLPVPWIYFHETKDPWVPYSMRYQNRVARGMGTAGLSVRLPVRGAPKIGGVLLDDALQGGLWLGFGLSVRPRGIINVDLDIIGIEGDPPQVEATLNDVDLAARYVIRPQVSALLDFGTFDKRLEGLRLGASWSPASRTEISPIALDVEVINLAALNGLFGLVELIKAEVFLGLTDMFDPHQVRISMALDRPRFAIEADAQVNLWSQLAASYGQVVTGLNGEQGSLSIDFGGESGPDVYEAVSGRVLDDNPFHDTVDANLGVELRPPGWAIAGKPDPLELRVRFGVRWQQSAVSASPGASGLLDGHNLGGGFGLGVLLPVKPGTLLTGPVTIDWGLQVQRLFPVDLPKTDAGLGDVIVPVQYASDARWPGGWVVASGLSAGLSF